MANQGEEKKPEGEAKGQDAMQEMLDSFADISDISPLYTAGMESLEPNPEDGCGNPGKEGGENTQDAMQEILNSFTEEPDISPLQMADIEKFNVSPAEIDHDLKKGEEEQHPGKS